MTSGSDGQVLRAARRFGLVAAAGELAAALDILPWPRGEAIAAAGVMFKAWIGRRGGTGSAEDRNILSRLKLFIEAHGASRFSSMTVPDGEAHRPVINRAGFFRSALGGSSGDPETVREYLFPRESWGEVFAGFDLVQVNRLLLGRGILSGDSQGKSAQSITLPELGKTRCYVVSAERLNDGE